MHDEKSPRGAKLVEYEDVLDMDLALRRFLRLLVTSATRVRKIMSVIVTPAIAPPLRPPLLFLDALFSVEEFFKATSLATSDSTIGALGVPRVPP